MVGSSALVIISYFEPVWTSVIGPAVGWTSDSAVHRIPRRPWWTALRLSSLVCRVDGAKTKAGY